MNNIQSEHQNDQMKVYASEFARKITKKNVFGKFPAGTLIPGLPTGIPEGSQARAFYDHGPDKFSLGNLEKLVIYNLLPKITVFSREFRLNNLISNQIILVNNGALTICFYQDPKNVDRGGDHPAYVQVELPLEDLDKLIVEIKSNPDFLEFFYQASFPELDSRDELPGARRIKSEGFYLLDINQTIPLVMLLEKVKNSLSQAGSLQINSYFSSVPYYQYLNGPFGTGDSIS